MILTVEYLKKNNLLLGNEFENTYMLDSLCGLKVIKPFVGCDLFGKHPKFIHMILVYEIHVNIDLKLFAQHNGRTINYNNIVCIL